MPTADRGPDRYHALDALRGAAMFLGIVLHAGVPYTKRPVPFWPVRDLDHWALFDFLLIAIHDFRMQAFFLLAGFFGCLLYTRYGWRRTTGHRLRRVALPLLLAMLTIQPLVQAVGVYAATGMPWPVDLSVFGEKASPAGGPRAAVIQHFASGAFLNHLGPAHLWFLWFLLLCFAVILPLAALADQLRSTALGRAWDAAVRRLFRSRLRWPVLALLTWPLLWPMSTPAGPDTPLGWVPSAHLLGYYFLFFLAGWTLYRHRDLLGRFAGGWKPGLAAGQLLILPVAIGLADANVNPQHFDLIDGSPFRVPAMAVFALYTWLTVGGLLGMFLDCLSVERAWIRWLADSSYWCYLASLPPILLFQYLAIWWRVGPGVKFMAVTAGTVALLLATYRWGVRYTWVGVLLNGPRTRPVPAEPVTLPLPVPERRAA